MPSNHLILRCPHLFLPSILPSIRVFSSESVLWIKWSKYWSFSFSVSPSNEYSGLISFRIDRFDHLAIQGNLKSLLLHHSHNSCSEVSNCFLPGDLLLDLLLRRIFPSHVRGKWRRKLHKIPWTEELGRLQSMESQRVRLNDWHERLNDLTLSLSL